MFSVEMFKKAIEEVKNSQLKTGTDFYSAVAKTYVRITMDMPDIGVITPGIVKSQIQKLGLDVGEKTLVVSKKAKILERIKTLENFAKKMSNADSFSQHLHELKQLIEGSTLKKAA